MKKLLFILLCFIPALTTFAKQISYAYDNAGNRISRQLVVTKNVKSVADTTKYVSDLLAEKNIRIYPNPTKGSLKIAIDGLDSDEVVEISLYDMNGKCIIKQLTEESITVIDISSRQAGLYMLHLACGKEETTWKIIKE